MKLIPLTRNKFAQVDDADFDWLNQFKWHALFVPKRKAWYAARRDGKRGPYLYMHRVIMATPKGMETDHRNGDGLNNQRENLRKATHTQNVWNTRKKRSGLTSPFIGVCRYGANGRFKAELSGKHLGVFDTAEEAARTYDAAARQLRGEFARTNF